MTYAEGDKVYYIRNDLKSWKGPAIVIGRDNHQIIVKHGGLLYRIHPCSLRLANSQCNDSNTSSVDTKIDENGKEENEDDYDDDDDDDDEEEEEEEEEGGNDEDEYNEGEEGEEIEDENVTNDVVNITMIVHGQEFLDRRCRS